MRKEERRGPRTWPKGTNRDNIWLILPPAGKRSRDEGFVPINSQFQSPFGTQFIDEHLNCKVHCMCETTDIMWRVSQAIEFRASNIVTHGERWDFASNSTWSLSFSHFPSSWHTLLFVERLLVVRFCNYCKDMSMEVSTGMWILPCPEYQIS